MSKITRTCWLFPTISVTAAYCKLHRLFVVALHVFVLPIFMPDLQGLTVGYATGRASHVFRSLKTCSLRNSVWVVAN